MGAKGKLTVKHDNPRKVRDDDDYRKDFVLHYFQNDYSEYEAMISAYENSTPEAQCGVILSYFQRKDPISFRMAKAAFRCGSNRVKIAKRGEVPKKGNSLPNVNALTSEDRQNLADFVDTLDTEPGFPCVHRRQKEYVIDPELTTLRAVYGRYKLWCSNQKPEARAMAESTFYRYIDAYHCTLAINKLKEDECDTCMELKEGNLIHIVPR